MEWSEYGKNGGIIVRTERDWFSVSIRTLKTEPHDSVAFLSFKQEVLGQSSQGGDQNKYGEIRGIILSTEWVWWSCWIFGFTREVSGICSQWRDWNKYGEIRSSVETSIVRAESLQRDQCKSEQNQLEYGEITTERSSKIYRDRHAHGEISVSNYTELACSERSQDTKISVGVEQSIHTAANQFLGSWIVAAYWSCVQHAEMESWISVFDCFQ